MVLKLNRDKITLHLSHRIGLELYWPTLVARKGEYAIYAPSVICFKPAHDWKWNVAAAVKVLGFGVGISHNHCDHPDYQAPSP